MERKVLVELIFKGEDWQDYGDVNDELTVEDSGIQDGLKKGVSYRLVQQQPSLSGVEQELNSLRLFKREMTHIINPILDYGQEHPEMKLGKSISEFVLSRAKQYDELKALSSGVETAGVWVKANDRLPEPGLITWRWLDKAASYSGYDEKGFIYDKGGAHVDPLYYIEIEWLDEQKK